MIRCKNPQTSPKVAESAYKILTDPTSSSGAKSLAAAALTRAPNQPKRKEALIVAKAAMRILRDTDRTATAHSVAASAMAQCRKHG